mmetsp:Transcript_61907/g.145072  ORF Transcript_61907/g.145072 Transcript_61907/m.145072 type:complete len:462 (-) Transcript_61907:154-1539(-)
MSDTVVVCASCPEKFHDEAAQLCAGSGMLKAFGKSGDMVNSLSGKDWVAKWEAKVVTCVVTAVRLVGAQKARILCVEGGKHCDLELAAQPKLVRAIRTELEDQEFQVRVEWMGYVDLKHEASALCKAKTTASKKGSQAPPAAPPKQKVEDKGKAALCKYFAEGKCTKGKACTYSHANPETTNQTAKNQMKPCKYFAAGKCDKGAACTYAHTTPTVVAEKSKDDNQSARQESKPPVSGWAFKCAGCKSYPMQGKAIFMCMDCGDFVCARCQSRKADFHDPSHKFTQFHSGPPEYYRCGQKGCKEPSFVDEKELILHQRQTKHAGSLWCVLRCFQCDKDFENWFSLSQHCAAKNHDPLWKASKKPQAKAKPASQPQRGNGQAKSTISMCPVCLKDFTTMEAMEQHMRDAGHDAGLIGMQPGMCQCGTCDKWFASTQACMQHMDDAHPSFLTRAMPASLFGHIH